MAPPAQHGIRRERLEAQISLQISSQISSAALLLGYQNTIKMLHKVDIHPSLSKILDLYSFLAFGEGVCNDIKSESMAQCLEVSNFS